MQLTDTTLLRQQAYIDGAWRHADDGATLDVSNPATGDRIGSVPKMGRDETARAIAAAAAAWPAWRKKSAKERATILRKWNDLILENAADLALLMTTEQGKPLDEAKGEVVYGASFIEWFAEEGKRVAGETLASPWPDRRLVVTREPIGVCAAITPWNFPIAMITRKVGPALAAGCTMVLKPAESTPFSALALALLAEQAGVPPGVFSVVTGDPKEIGAEMTSNPTVRKLSFTGSTAVGRLLMEQCAPTIKKLSLELGGNAPFIVFDDADLDAAVDGAIASKYRNAGQTCVCANRIYVQDGVYDRFAEKLVAAVARLKVGNGVEQGVTQDMIVAREETFGPLAPLFRFKTDEEALALANSTEFGLAAYFYSRDIGRVWLVAEGLESGMVGVNTGLISNEIAPFGGVKKSGLGREGSTHGIDDYLVIKYICMGGI